MQTTTVSTSSRAKAASSAPLTPSIGAEIKGVDLSTPMSDETLAFIRRTWEENSVVLLRNQSLSEDDQVRFAERFGPLATMANPELVTTSNPAIMLISNIQKDGKLIGNLPDGELQFHTDQSYVEKPATGSMLYALEIPSVGGNTMFASSFKAYDELPTRLKILLDGKLAMHGYDPAHSKYTRPATFGPNVKQFAQPIFRTHPPTGRKTLYISRLHTQYIVGLPKEQSDEVLEELFEHLEQRKYVYEHFWRVGDLLFWDNRSCTHARTDFDAKERRLLRRVTLLGERAY
jgi:taurine dioxygenase